MKVDFEDPDDPPEEGKIVLTVNLDFICGRLAETSDPLVVKDVLKMVYEQGKRVGAKSVSTVR